MQLLGTHMYVFFQVCKLLCKVGASVKAKEFESGATPLYVAALNGHVGALSTLLKNGAVINSVRMYSQTTPPPFCALCDVVFNASPIFLFPVSKVDNNGETSLYAAVIEGHDAAALVLINAGCDVNIKALLLSVAACRVRDSHCCTHYLVLADQHWAVRSACRRFQQRC